MVRTEATLAVPQMPCHHDEPKKSGKQKRKDDADEEGIVKEERRREKRLHREAERHKRQDAKNGAKDRRDEDIANSKPVNERVLSPSLDQGPGVETQCVRTKKKKKKRLKSTPVDDKLDEHIPISTEEQTIEGEDCARRSKKRRRDQTL